MINHGLEISNPTKKNTIVSLTLIVKSSSMVTSRGDLSTSVVSAEKQTQWAASRLHP